MQQTKEGTNYSNWKASISKAELAELPAEKFTGKIRLVESLEAADEAAAVLSRTRLIGFDTETKPSFRRGEHNNVALLQLSTKEETFLLRLNRIGLPDSIKAILEDESIIKVGVSIHDDFLNLHKKFTLDPKGFIDLQSYVKQFNIADNSLSRIYGIIFGKRISKGQRLSNWEASQLTTFQQEYAALDAIACIDIYNHLSTAGFDCTKSKYYKEIVDPTVQDSANNQTES